MKWFKKDKKVINECETVGEIRELQKEREILKTELSKIDYPNVDPFKNFRNLVDFKSSYYNNSLHFFEMVGRLDPLAVRKMLQQSIDEINIYEELIVKASKYRNKIQEIETQIAEKKRYLGIK